MIRVLIVDDQGLVRAGFRALLESEEDVEVVGEAGDGAAALRLVAEHHPDVVLMDIRMPELDGIEATRRIAQDPRLHDVRIVILTTYETDEYVFEGLRAGASGFLVKDTSPTELIRAVRLVADGQALLAPSVTRRLIAEVVPRRAPTRPIPGLRDLTVREREILGPGRLGAVERRDRGAADDQPRDCQDPRESDHGQARGARSRAAGGVRV